MRNENLSSRKRKYLIAFTFVSGINVLLVVVLLTTSFGQKLGRSIKSYPSVKVEVVNQNSNPLLITIINVDNSQSSHQKVNYTTRNIGVKPVRAYALLGSNKPGVVKTQTKHQVIKLLQPGETTQNEWFEENENIDFDSPLFLSVDYVAFKDGSFWGEDSQKMSEMIAGNFEGQTKAIQEVRDFIKKKNTTTVFDFLEQKRNESVFYVNSEQTKLWQRGFQLGYNAVLGQAQFVYKEKGENEIFSRLDVIETIIGKGAKE